MRTTTRAFFLGTLEEEALESRKKRKNSTFEKADWTRYDGTMIRLPPCLLVV